MTNQLRVERARRRWSQAKLAELVEVSRQTINAIEGGKYVPSTVLALKIARRFELPFEEVFELEAGDWEQTPPSREIGVRKV